jgi:hypothetical protein
VVEYKELERALIARMFRQGIISGTVFMDRAQALGYDPNDVFLMLQLETSEAAKVLLIGSGVYSLGVSNNEIGKQVSQTTYSPSVNCVGLTYVLATFSGGHSVEGGYGGILQFLDASDGVVLTKTGADEGAGYIGASHSGRFSIAAAPPTNAVKVRVGGSAYLRAGQIGSASVSLESLEGIKL